MTRARRAASARPRPDRMRASRSDRWSVVSTSDVDGMRHHMIYNSLVQATSPSETMNGPPIRDTDVFIAGAGPTGLVLALWLTRLGVRVRIVDKTTEPGTTSRALAVQARTLELYRQVGLADAVVARGRPMRAINLWAAGKPVAHAVLGDMGGTISPFPYALIFPQDEHERLLIDRLALAGVHIERDTELVALEEESDRVLIRLKRADGAVETCEAAYVAGCDGAHSTVRQIVGLGFPGGTYN